MTSLNHQSIGFLGQPRKPVHSTNTSNGSFPMAPARNAFACKIEPKHDLRRVLRIPNHKTTPDASFGDCMGGQCVFHRENKDNPNCARPLGEQELYPGSDPSLCFCWLSGPSNSITKNVSIVYYVGTPIHQITSVWFSLRTLPLQAHSETCGFGQFLRSEGIPCVS